MPKIPSTAPVPEPRAPTPQEVARGIRTTLVWLAVGFAAALLVAVLAASSSRGGSTVALVAFMIAGLLMVLLLISLIVWWAQRPVEWHEEEKEGETLDDCRL